MTITISDADRGAINQAASLLDAIGATASDGKVAIRSLLAAELLVQAGAVSALPTTQPDDERAAIGHALQLLGGLDDDVLDDQRLLAAMRHALLAHAATR